MNCSLRSIASDQIYVIKKKSLKCGLVPLTCRKSARRESKLQLQTQQGMRATKCTWKFTGEKAAAGEQRN